MEPDRARHRARARRLNGDRACGPASAACGVTPCTAAAPTAISTTKSRTAFDLAVDEQIRRGVDPDRARRLATLQFGRPAAIAAQVREVRAGAALDDLCTDVGSACVCSRGRRSSRSPRSSRWRSASARPPRSSRSSTRCCCAIFASAHPEQLVEIGRSHAVRPRRQLLLPDLPARCATATRSSAARWRSRGASSQADVDTTPAPVGRVVSENFFDTLQVPPQLGRVIVAERCGPGTAVAVLSHGFWQRQFGAASECHRSIPGRRSDASFTIVGVLPASFDDPVVGRPADFYIPMASEPSIRRQSWLKRRRLQLAGDHRPARAGRLAARPRRPTSIRSSPGSSTSTAGPLRIPPRRKNYLSHRLDTGVRPGRDRRTCAGSSPGRSSC